MSEIIENGQVGDQPVGTIMVPVPGHSDSSAHALVLTTRGWEYVADYGTTTCRVLVGRKYEVLRRPAKPVKVGDVIETREGVDALPEDAVVIDKYDDVCRHNGMGGWVSIDGGRPVLPAKLIHLPEK